MKRIFLTLVFSSILITSVSAQEKNSPLSPDRPSFSTSPVTIRPGYVQFESGISFSKEKISYSGREAEISDISVLGTTVRIGISEMFELMFGGGYLIENEKSGALKEINRKGLSDLMLGGKFYFLSSANSIMDVGLIFNLRLPFGSSDFKPENAEPKLCLAIKHNIADVIELNYNIGTSYVDAGAEYRNFYSVCCGLPMSERIGIYAEHYGFFSKTMMPTYYADAGISYLQSSNIMVDLSFGKEVTAGTSYWFIGAGFSLRLPD
jgi:hypothetical protein